MRVVAVPILGRLLRGAVVRLGAVVGLGICALAAPARADVVEPTVEMPAPSEPAPAPESAHSVPAELPSGPPGMQESQFDACIAHRRAIYRDAMLARELDERGRLLRSMPECRLPPPRPATPATSASSGSTYVAADAGPPGAAPGAAAGGPGVMPLYAPHDGAGDPSARPTPIPSTYSFMAEPVSLAFVTLGLQVERAVSQSPSIGIAAHAGIGNPSNVTIGERVHTIYRGDSFDDLREISFVRLHAGGQVNLYIDRPFRGPHVGIEGVYKHFSPDDDKGGIAVMTGSIYGGWKWVRRNGFTAMLQLGASIVGKRDDDAMTSAMTGWEHDREGTLGGAHLFGNLAAGFSL